VADENRRIRVEIDLDDKGALQKLTALDATQRSFTGQVKTSSQVIDELSRLLGRYSTAAAASVEQTGEVRARLEVAKNEATAFNAALRQVADMYASASRQGKDQLEPQLKSLAMETQAAEAKVRTLTNELKVLEGRSGLTGYQMTALGRSMQGVGLTLSASVTAPIVGFGTASAMAAIKFETAFAGVRKTVSGTPQELDAINTQFREMAKVTPTSAVELSKIGETAGQLGIKTSAIKDFTKTIVDITTATHLTAEEASTSFAKLANVMHVPQTEFENLGSAVYSLGNFGASTEKEMIEMSQRIAAAGATAGMTAAQVLGISNALASVGIEAEAGGTAISRVITKMASDVASGGGHLAQFAKVAGMSAKQFQDAFHHDAGVAFSTFMQGLANMKGEGEKLFKTIDELGFKEVRLRNAMLSAANAGTLMADSIKLGSDSYKDHSAFLKAVTDRYQTTENQMKVFQNRLTDIEITLGQALVPALISLMDVMKPLVDLAADGAEIFKELPTPLRDIGITAVAAVAGLGPGLLLTGTLVKAWGNLEMALGTTSATVGVLRTAIGSLGTVMAGLFIGAIVGTAIDQLRQMAEAGSKTRIALDLLPPAITAVTMAIAGFGGPVTIAATALVALTTAVTEWLETSAKAKVRAQEQGAAADELALASKRAGHAITDLTEARKINTQFVEDARRKADEHAKAVQGQTKATKDNQKALEDADLRYQLTHNSLEKLDAGLQKLILDGFAHGHTVAEVTKLLKDHNRITEEQLGAVSQLHDKYKEHESLLKKVAAAKEDEKFATIPLTQAQIDQVHQLRAHNLTIAEASRLVGVHAIQVQNLERFEKELSKTLEHVHMGLSDNVVSVLAKQHGNEIASMKNVADAMADNLNRQKALQAEYDAAVDALGETSFDKKRAQLLHWQDLQEGELDYSVDNWREAYDAIQRVVDAKMNLITQDEQAAVRKMADDARKQLPASFSEAFGKIADQIPQILSQGLTGGGGLASGFQAIGLQASHAFASSFAGNATKDLGNGSIISASGLTGGLEKGLMNVGLGSKLASSLAGGLMSAGIGTAITLGMQGLMKLFGPSEESKLVNKPRQMFIDAAGGLDSLNQKVMQATGSLKLVQDLLGSKTEANYKKSVDAINQALEVFAQKQKAAYTALNDVGTKLNQIHHITPEVQAALEKAYNAKSIDEYNAALAQVAGIMDDQAAKQQQLDSALQKYGLTWKDTGEAARAAKLGELAKGLYDDFNTLQGAGIDINVQMKAMGGNIRDFIKDAKKTGTEVPEFMRKVIQSAIDAGEVFDDNGQKVTDLTQLGLTFGTTFEDQMKGVTDAITRLADVLEKGLKGAFTSATGAADSLRNAVQNIPDHKEIRITYTRDGDGGDVAHHGGYVHGRGAIYHDGGYVQRYHSGGLANDEVPAILQTGEGVLNRRAMRRLGEAGLRTLNSGQGAHTATRGLAISIGDVHVGSGYKNEDEFGADLSRAVISKLRRRGVRFSARH
jgi:TP901 family phage tail tape measure protein